MFDVTRVLLNSVKNLENPRAISEIPESRILKNGFDVQRGKLTLVPIFMQKTLLSLNVNPADYRHVELQDLDSLNTWK